MTEQTEYKQAIFKAAGKNSFFEVYDALDINKFRLQVQLNDPETHKATQRATYYLNYDKMWTLCALALNGNLNDFLAEKRGFPSVDFGIPPASTNSTRMRQLTISPLTEKNRHMITIIEKERQDEWSKDAPDIAKATFFLSPVDLVTMAKKLDWYIGNFLTNNPDKF